MCPQKVLEERRNGTENDDISSTGAHIMVMITLEPQISSMHFDVGIINCLKTYPATFVQRLFVIELQRGRQFS